MNYRSFACPGPGVSETRPERAAGWTPTATVADITRPSASTVGEYDHIAAAAYLMKHARSAALVVLGVQHGSRPVGVITEADIARAVAAGMDANKTRIHDLATARPSRYRRSEVVRGGVELPTFRFSGSHVIAGQGGDLAKRAIRVRSVLDHY
jgi:CBS domain-containing protein